jgi:glycosyltransferase involved in cell wall biosynthesis
VRFGYAGRLVWEKGLGVLLEALRGLGRDVPLEMVFLSTAFDGGAQSEAERAWARKIRAMAEQDRRMVVLGGVPPERSAERMAEWDALIVPSLWMETGPQVVTEALLAGTPVIGSARGGLAELIEEGRSGWLFPPGDARALGGLLRRLSLAPDELRAMAARIPPPRTADDMVEDMLAVYRDAR